MEFSINHTRQPEDPKSGLVKIGWFFADDTSSVVYFPPERSRTVDMNRTHAKSASRCISLHLAASRCISLPGGDRVGKSLYDGVLSV